MDDRDAVSTRTMPSLTTQVNNNTLPSLNLPSLNLLPPSPCHPSTCHPSPCHPSTCHPSTCHPSTCHPSTCHPTFCHGAMRNHLLPTLKKLHWLPIKQRIDYKICLLTYKTLTNQQPTYLYNSLSFPSHSVSTRSSDSLVLSIPYVRSSLGKRAFSVIGPRLWNSLPSDTRNSSSLPIFRSRLKTHLFKIAFPP